MPYSWHVILAQFQPTKCTGVVPAQSDSLGHCEPSALEAARLHMHNPWTWWVKTELGTCACNTDRGGSETRNACWGSVYISYYALLEEFCMWHIALGTLFFYIYCDSWTFFFSPQSIPGLLVRKGCTLQFQALSWFLLGYEGRLKMHTT